jgi:endonuclease YncB( thermonuclease family)
MRRTFPILLALIVAGSARGSDYSARVVGISDGDTITVLKDRTQVRIRLHGIDAPETGQDHGSRAKQFASELAFGKQVTIRVRTTDRYGRTVADVILPDGRWLNREMVRAGMAWWYRRYAPADTELARLESEAKAARRGLWSQPNPVPPWSWRNGGGAPQTTAVIGNRRSHVYHKPTCRGATSMSEKNRVRFDTAAQAEAAGYRQAWDCR